MRLHISIAALLCGCATHGPDIGEGPERHYTGVIENVEKTTRAGASRAALMPLMLFGAIGGAIYGAATGAQPTRMHVIKLDSGASMAVIADDEFNPGDCVRIIVNDKSAEPLPWYAYGQAKLEPIACSSPAK